MRKIVAALFYFTCQPQKQHFVGQNRRVLWSSLYCGPLYLAVGVLDRLSPPMQRQDQSA